MKTNEIKMTKTIPNKQWTTLKKQWKTIEKHWKIMRNLGKIIKNNETHWKKQWKVMKIPEKKYKCTTFKKMKNVEENNEK